MKSKDNVYWISVVIVILLITFKIWIKMKFELQLIGLILLIGLSWTAKFFIFKKLRNREKK